jgi:hypothetical protein
MSSEEPLAIHGGSDGVVGRFECDEKGVALGPELVAVVPQKGRTKQPLMLLQDVRVAVPKTLQKSRGTLYIGEEKGDLTSWNLRHPRRSI